MESHENGSTRRQRRKPTAPPPFSTHFFQTLLETIPSPIFFKDTEGRYLGCNEAFAAYLGRPRESIIGKTVYDIAPPELADIYRSHDQELFEHPGVQVYASQVRFADGSLRDVQFHKATFNGSDGHLGGLVGVLFDVSDRKHRIVADNTYDWEFWLDPMGRFEYCSPSCQRITHHPREAFVNDPDLLRRILHPEDRERFDQHWREVREGNTPCVEEIQFRVIRPDGSLRWIGHVCQPVFDTQGTYLGIRGSNRDITEQKRAEEALQASEKRYHALFNGMSEGFALHEILLDGHGSPCDYRFLDVNPAFERLTGLKRDVAVGRRLSDLLPGETKQWVDIYGPVATTGQSIRFEDYSSGLKKHFEVFAYRPAPGQFATLFVDISERKDLERERERLLSQLRAVVDNLDTGLIITDAEGRVTEMNPAARRLCGYTNEAEARRHALESRLRWDLLTLQGQVLALRDWPRQRTLRGETFRNWELQVRPKDGSPEWIASFGGAPILDGTGQVMMTVVSLRDVTQRRRAQEELERKVRERTSDLDRFNRTLQAIIDCNQAIIRATREEDLFHEFCRISTRVAGVDLAWVGLAETDEDRRVRPVAAIGFHQRQLAQARISWGDNARGQGPAGKAIRTGELCFKVCDPIESDLFIEREEDIGLGFGAVLALPLLEGERAFGALVLCSATPETFDEQQVRMLRELANNLSIGVQALRSRQERDRALATSESLAEQLRALSLELVQAEQRERHRLAQILHDDLQQLLVGASFSVEALAGKARGKALQDSLGTLAGTIAEALEVSRSMTQELSPPIFYEQGLVAGLEWVCSLMHRKYGLQVALEVLGEVGAVPDQIRLFLLEAARELLLNVVKHAQVSQVRIRVRPLEGTQLEVTVADQGAGFDLVKPKPSGFGLFSIREKLRFLHGHLSVESAPNQGSRFTLVVPCEEWNDRPQEGGTSGCPSGS
mgnify:CR=1 FL=1